MRLMFTASGVIRNALANFSSERRSALSTRLWSERSRPMPAMPTGVPSSGSRIRKARISMGIASPVNGCFTRISPVQLPVRERSWSMYWSFPRCLSSAKSWMRNLSGRGASSNPSCLRPAGFR